MFETVAEEAMNGLIAEIIVRYILDVIRKDFMPNGVRNCPHCAAFAVRAIFYTS